MFEIQYRIPEHIAQEISSLTIYEFDSEHHDIDGQIELNFNSKKYGICDLDFPFEQEWLFWWFGLLNEVVSRLKKNNYVAMYIPETASSFFEFTKNNGILKISFSTIAEKSFDGYLLDTPLQGVVKQDWVDEKISFDEFNDEVILKTKCLIEEIKKINPEIYKSKNVNRFILECGIDI